MKITTEKALDLLPTFAAAYEKLDFKGYIQMNKFDASKLSEDEKKKVSKQKGNDMILYILKNSRKIKDEIIQIIAIFSEKTEDEVREQNPLVTINTFKEILTDKEAMDFFIRAME